MNAPKRPDPPTLLWDIFCQVIDNHGDLGVCWRLSCQLAARGQRVRLWVDDARALSWMAPQGCPGVELRAWTPVLDLQGLAASDVLVEAFGCEVAPEFVTFYANAVRASGINPAWINLEYLSAEPYVERNHGLASPIMCGPGAGLSKHFFYPGFTPRTGGLLREPDLMARQARFDRDAWLHGIGFTRQAGERLISLFCYEPPALPGLLEQLANEPVPSRLLVTAGRATTAVQTVIEQKVKSNPSWNERKQLSISYLPHLSQNDFDHLLWACDLNFVRGEDSLVRALWAGQPFVWQIYPQHDNAHHDKLEAFLTLMQAPDSLRQWHRYWNNVADAGALPLIPLAPLELPLLGHACRAARQGLLQQDDLFSQLLAFVSTQRAKKH